ncbi:Oxidase ustYa [Cladobotryum mycophilum]|uniref:Oxidase ustYa n=1 Tax=Cladobotryum mycophilum TaxID=491253 RepID=A0ABR0SJA5_9HYPO
MMEDYRDDRSSTAKDSDADSESISLEEKEGLLETAPMHLSKSTKTMSRYRLFPILAAIMAIANVILGALLVVQFQSSRDKSTPPHTPHPHHHHKKPPPVPIGGLPHVESAPDWLPPEQWRTEVFRLHEIYGEEPVGTAKEAWLSLIPKGKGFIVVKNDTELPHMPGLRHPEQEQHACVAIFHQLHCLYITYAAYWNARAGNFDDIPPEHLIHCWDYLRQSIMCAGDTSLEWVSAMDDPPNETSGWGFQHTCKNFDAIFDWTESNRYTETVDID